MKLEIKFNPEDVAKVKLLLSEIEADKVMTYAINDTLRGVKTDATKAAYAELNLTQQRIQKNFTLTFARRDNISGAFASKGEPINLASFIGTRQGARGLSVKIFRTGTRQVFKHGFLWTRPTKSGEMASTAFQRAYKGEYGRTKASNQLPWKKMYPGTNPAHERREVETMTSLRLEDFLSRPAVIADLEQKGADRLEKNTADSLEYILSKHKAT